MKITAFDNKLNEKHKQNRSSIKDIEDKLDKRVVFIDSFDDFRKHSLNNL